MIVDDFKEILDNFETESEKPFKNNVFASKMRNEFTDDFKEFVLDIIGDMDKYDSKVSPGMLGWTKRPWAGLRNNDATNTFQGGLYLIFIFDFENNGFHLSLDQGADYPKKSVRIDISNYLINLINESNLKIPQGFVCDETKVNEDSILSKFYDINNVSIDELKEDLKSLIEIYEFLIPKYMGYIAKDDSLLNDYPQKWLYNANKDYFISANIIKNYLVENNLGDLEKQEYEEMFSSFKSKFSPEILEKLEGIELLNSLFLHDGDKNNLGYCLEFSEEFKKAGGIGGGSAYKYSLFKNKNGQWVYGTSKKNSQILNENEAIEIASLLRNNIVEGANYIKTAQLNSIEDYKALEVKLSEIFNDCLLKPNFSWIHKYYTLLYPEKFPVMHSEPMKKDFLTKFKIEPETWYYAMDAQFYQLSKKAGLKFYSIFDENIVRLFFKGGKDIWEYTDDVGIGDNDVKTTRYWLISAGQGAYLWEEFYKNGEIGIGFDGTGDLNQYKTKEEIKLKFQEIHNDNSSHRNNVHACWQFVHDMQIGDVIFVKKGWNEILGRGIVESDYEYNPNKPYHKIRKVRWTHKGSWTTIDQLPTKTLTDVTMYQEFVDNIKRLFVGEDGESEEIPENQYPEYDEIRFLEEVYIDERGYYTLVNLLKNKKNLIVQGAPGVGKTFMAKRLAYSIMGEKNTERVMMVQFHQSYSYEDFVMGYRPSKEGFDLKRGSFYEFCKKAEEDSENDYFFIIDEINRGNLSKIFGELFMLIESDKRGEKNRIRLVYSNEFFFIPKNVYIIGLMNTADRSLAMIDYALRRRFAFFDLKPGFESDGFMYYQNELDNDKFSNIIEVMKELNEDIKNDESLGEGFRIGHSYLCNIKAEDVEEKLNFVVEYELIPLLKEYWFDEQDKVEYWSNRLRSVIDDSEQDNLY
ncbi:MAG: DUF3578 domain-containing protein [Methanobrevibacter sp.]|uniref:MrcB family domain-containing protein n=1 Tax=Methanobrevibacter sp. TaxID=66852 RepID=UPI0025D97821|nr:DUF3578 domain-containing protein [Methanobrevibacter sp.]MBR6993920.1 DUF3578 domain-containing protein [Methanobrevibacter sp.]